MTTLESDPGDSPLRSVPDDYGIDEAATTGWFRIPEGRDAGRRLFVADRTFGEDPEATVVLVHGNPECSYTYRHVVDELDRQATVPYRLVVMDHLGFGRSDTATYEMVSMDHARNLRHLVSTLDLTDVTLAVHDWGGPIGVGAFLREPERVSNLVVMNSTVFPIPDGGITYNDYPIRWLPWARYPDVTPDALWGDLAAYAIFRTPAGPARVLGGLGADVARNYFGEPLTPAKRVFRRQFAVRRNAWSSKRLVRQAGVWATGNTYVEPTLGPRDTGPFYEFVQDSLPEEWGPDGREIGVRAVVGRWDPLGREAVLDQWREALPQLEGNVRAFDRVGHFVEEFRPAAVARSVVDVADLRPDGADRATPGGRAEGPDRGPGPD